jgi:hypothetical protein
MNYPAPKGGRYGDPLPKSSSRGIPTIASIDFKQMWTVVSEPCPLSENFPERRVTVADGR